MSKVKDKISKSTGFSQKLKALRKKQGITMVELGKAIEVSFSYISMLEAGERQPSREVVEKLAVAFFPEGNDAVRDELLLLAGFRPVNLSSYTRPKDQVARCEHSLAENERDFKAFMALLIALIKARKYDTAKDKIQKGFQLFTHSVQWQALFSIQELIKGNYESAILSQQTAIDYFNLPANRSNSDVDLSDLLKNLGVIHFLQGSEHLGHAMGSDNKSKAAAEEKRALKNFETARQKFEQAMELAPDDIYILDEYARLHFNLAFMAGTLPRAAELWDTTIAYFKKVLYADNKEELGSDYLLEASAFLAHAYSKSRRFEAAEYALNLAMAGAPQAWLLHYVKACLFSLMYEQDPSPELLQKSLRSLQKAVAIEDSQNRASQDARMDPDLQAVRTLEQPSFQAIIERK